MALVGVCSSQENRGRPQESLVRGLNGARRGMCIVGILGRDGYCMLDDRAGLGVGGNSVGAQPGAGQATKVLKDL